MKSDRISESGPLIQEWPLIGVRRIAFRHIGASKICDAVGQDPILAGQASINLDMDASVQTAEMKAKAARASELLRSMSNEGRLMILCNLIEKERSVSELEQLVELSQSSVSQHLAILRRDRLVKKRRSGQNIYYSLASREAAAIMRTLYDVFCKDAEAALDL